MLCNESYAMKLYNQRPLPFLVWETDKWDQPVLASSLFGLRTGMGSPINTSFTYLVEEWCHNTRNHNITEWSPIRNATQEYMCSQYAKDQTKALKHRCILVSNKSTLFPFLVSVWFFPIAKWLLILPWGEGKCTERNIIHLCLLQWRNSATYNWVAT